MAQVFGSAKYDILNAAHVYCDPGMSQCTRLRVPGADVDVTPIVDIPLDDVISGDHFRSLFWRIDGRSHTLPSAASVLAAYAAIGNPLSVGDVICINLINVSTETTMTLTGSATIVFIAFPELLFHRAVGRLYIRVSSTTAGQEAMQAILLVQVLIQQ